MNKILTTVSVIALISTTSVFASEKQELAESASEAVKDIAEETEKKYEELKSFVFGDESENLELTTTSFDADYRAENIIGRAVHNLNERVGTVHDIILDSDGNAVLAVIADGEIFGLGKLVAINYSDLMDHKFSDAFLMSITEENIDQIAEFTYEKNRESKDIRVIPQNGYSLAKLLDSDLTNKNGQSVAEIDDVYLEDGKASHLIVDFDEVYYDETVAVEYEIAQIVAKDGDYSFQLLSPRELQLENFKTTSQQ